MSIDEGLHQGVQVPFDFRLRRGFRPSPEKQRSNKDLQSGLAAGEYGARKRAFVEEILRRLGAQERAALCVADCLVAAS